MDFDTRQYLRQQISEIQKKRLKRDQRIYDELHPAVRPELPPHLIEVAVPGICLECGTTYKPTVNRKYCSTPCKNNHWYKTQRARNPDFTRERERKRHAKWRERHQAKKINGRWVATA